MAEIPWLHEQIMSSERLPLWNLVTFHWGLFYSQSSDVFVILSAICYQGVDCFQVDEMCLNWKKLDEKKDQKYRIKLAIILSFFN